MIIELLKEFHALGIEELMEITELHELKGAFINLEYKLPSGQSIKLWEEDKIYLGNEICKRNSERCYGIAADDKYLMVCEYGNGGANPELIIFKRWN